MSKELEILIQHNKWRKGDESIEMINPSELSNAIDVIILQSKQDKERISKLEFELKAADSDYGNRITDLESKIKEQSEYIEQLKEIAYEMAKSLERVKLNYEGCPGFASLDKYKQFKSK